ncbi:hypothetical protein Tco_1551387 [Tanacetum coccineum]
MLDSDFIPFDDSLGSDLEVSFPSGTRNKIFDPGIFFEVQSKRFLTRDIFSISFICNPLFPVIESLLLFSSENEDKVFNHGILSSNLLSHRGKIGILDLSENCHIGMRADHGLVNFYQSRIYYYYYYLQSLNDYHIDNGSEPSGIGSLLVTDIAHKDKKRSKTDKTKHGNGKSTRNRSQRRIYLKSNLVNSLA